MKIFLVRHGNTFGDDQASGEHIFLCGSQSNIPLVRKGREQARMMAQYLDVMDVIPTALYANHLIRVWEHAVLIREYFYYRHQITIPIYLDEQLIELDYGHWAGLVVKGQGDNQIITQFGQKAWDDWQLRRIMPTDPVHGWKMTCTEIVSKVKSFFEMLKTRHQVKDVIVAIGSQGSLGFVNELFEGGMGLAVAEDRFKIKTGNFSEISYDQNGFQLVNWNQDPWQIIQEMS
jgi:broad specificity phosphatase PhoE